jgi:hypothetical protein
VEEQAALTVTLTYREYRRLVEEAMAAGELRRIVAEQERKIVQLREEIIRLRGLGNGRRHRRL